MSTDLFEQLAESQVPPAPEEFDGDVHQRLNRMLLSSHFVELVLYGLPFAFSHFMSAVYGLIRYSITGRFDKDRK